MHFLLKSPGHGSMIDDCIFISIMASNSSIPKTMKAIRLHEYGGNYRFDNDVPVPSDLDDYDVLLAIKSAGFCHSEVLARDGMFKEMTQELPIIPSHEPRWYYCCYGQKSKQ